MKTCELTGIALDWAVARAVGARKIERYEYNGQTLLRIYTDEGIFAPYEPSRYWNQGGPIIEREIISVWPYDDVTWKAETAREAIEYEGETPLIAAMRCYVASKLGDDVEIPEELL